MDCFKFCTDKLISCKRFVDLLTFLLASPGGPSFYFNPLLLNYVHGIYMAFWIRQVKSDRKQGETQREREGQREDEMQQGATGWNRVQGPEDTESLYMWRTLYQWSYWSAPVASLLIYRQVKKMLPSVSKLLVDMLPWNMKQTMFYKSCKIPQHPLNGLAQI